MKFFIKIALTLLLCSAFSAFAQNNEGLEKIGQVSYNKNNPNFIKLNDSYVVYEHNTEDLLNSVILNDVNLKVKKFQSQTDHLGYTHSKYNVYYRDALIDNSIIIVHSLRGRVVSLNGDLAGFVPPSNSVSLTEAKALEFALEKVNARKYKWENTAEEQLMKEKLNDPSFSYAPNGKLLIFSQNGASPASNFAYRFTIYAEEPLSISKLFVDAQNGKILNVENLLCTVDASATANTKYSLTQTITTDDAGGGLYRLRETGRGNGIETYNLNNTTTYTTATDFTNTATSWTNTNTDQIATDAHWGAEMTYDYYLSAHNRNSIDGNGFKLMSFVHYSNSYNNAFWNGFCMTYGDGDGSMFTPLTALDVCGHEVTHGLTAKTASLVYSNESGALNESYSDIFGTMVENYGRPSNWDWIIGKDMTPSGNGIRSMSNPNAFGHPDTYLGTNYYLGTADNGGVHSNSGVSNYWFHLLSLGGTGVNDLSNSYTVTGISMTKAAKIAFRALTIYYTPSTTFNDARGYSIQAATDLYGLCSTEMIQTANAWHAVGVGPAWSMTLTPDFNSLITSYCSYPASVQFNNTTPNGLSYVWNFGDGVTSTSVNPVHSYTANGTYEVKLKAFGCNSQVDSLIKSAYITVSLPPTSTLVTGGSRCGPGTVNLSASGSGQQSWYSASSATGTPLYTGNSFTTPVLNSNTTYYVSNTFTNVPVFGAASSTAIGGVINFPGNTAYEVFDVSQSGIIKSVVMHANIAGNRVIQLRNSTNTVIASATVNLSAGTNTVTLNFNVIPGSGYRLGLSSASTAGLYCNSSGASYPYAIGGILTITGSSSSNPGFYYYFYNWEVVQQNCTSPPIAVTASVNLGNVTGSLADDSLCTLDAVQNLIGSPSGGTFSGTGVIGSVFDPAVGAGTYPVAYTFSDGSGCTVTDTFSVFVDACIGIKNVDKNTTAFNIFPNPAGSVIYLSGETGGKNLYDIELCDAVGKIILKRQTNDLKNYAVQIAGLSQGIYFISVSSEGRKSVRKFVKE